MWFARHAIMEFGEIHDITVIYNIVLKVTDYFMCNIDGHLDKDLEEQWSKKPSDLGNPKDFSTITKELFYTEPLPNKSHQVPRFTLTTFQPNWTLSYYCFLENDDKTDLYLWNPFQFQFYKDSWEAYRIKEKLDKGFLDVHTH